MSLHNYLLQTTNASYCPVGFIDCEDGDGNILPREWRSIVNDGNTQGCLTPIINLRGRLIAGEQLAICTSLTEYFQTDQRRVSCQFDYIRKTPNFINLRDETVL